MKTKLYLPGSPFFKNSLAGASTMCILLLLNYFPVEVLTEAVKQAKDYETAGVKAAEAGNVMESLDFFNKAISAAPERASGYNNRAQSLRLNGDVQGRSRDSARTSCLSFGQVVS